MLSADIVLAEVMVRTGWLEMDILLVMKLSLRHAIYQARSRNNLWKDLPLMMTLFRANETTSVMFSIRAGMWLRANCVVKQIHCNLTKAKGMVENMSTRLVNRAVLVFVCLRDP